MRKKKEKEIWDYIGHLTESENMGENDTIECLATVIWIKYDYILNIHITLSVGGGNHGAG